jgi:microcystin-dependent protein
MLGLNKRDVQASPEFLRYLDQVTRAIDAEGTPAGTLRATLAADEPSGWKRLDGQTLAKSDYLQLYSVIGDTFGSTATTFNLPDMAGRTVIGAGAIALAEFGGASSITLIEANLPSHTHAVTDAGHTHAFTGTPHGHTVTDPGHTHTITDPEHSHGGVLEPGSTGGFTGSGDADYPANTDTAATGITIDSATTGITVADATAGGANGSATTGVTIGATGSGTAFDNTPAGLGVTFLVKT